MQQTFCQPGTWTRRAALTSLLGGVLTASGCTQFMMLGVLLGGPPSIEPDFDKETGKGLDNPDYSVAVICFAPTELKLSHPKVDLEVAQTVALRLQQNEIPVVNPDRVAAWLDQHRDWDQPEEVGAALKATHVIEIELADFDLYEQNSTFLYRGRTEAYINVYEMDEDGNGEKIYSKELDFMFPTEVARPATDMPLTNFKMEYLSRLSEKIGFLFYERYSGDLIPWAS
ncbi:MAG: hypothetical protein U0992_02185 [Planctomycetaceae bacterium]